MTRKAKCEVQRTLASYVASITSRKQALTQATWHILTLTDVGDMHAPWQTCRWRTKSAYDQEAAASELAGNW